MKTYKERIRELREDNDMVQEEIAKLLNTSQTVYSRYERGERKLPIDHVIKLALFYKTSTDYILGVTNKKEPYPRA